jgi:enoyl-CoA hydratase/carnithine racemase
MTDGFSDMVVASPTASFGLPEATVGLYAAAGGLPRIVRNCGLQIGSEIAMTGRRLSAKEVRTSPDGSAGPFLA